MLIELNLHGKQVMIIGAGNEALKRIKSLEKQGCKILVISDRISKQINNLARSKKIKLKKQKIENAQFLLKHKPYIVITTTDDKKLNKIIMDAAKKRGIIAYSSDNPDESDFANPAIIDFENTVQIAIFTGGKSPAMSKKIKTKSEALLRKIITKKDIDHIKLQKIARSMAQENISTQSERKRYLLSIMTDKGIDQLIKDGQLKKAERRAVTILRNWG